MSPSLSLYLSLSLHTLSFLSLSYLPLLQASRLPFSASLLPIPVPDPSLSPLPVFDQSLTRVLLLGNVMGSVCMGYGDVIHFLGIPYAQPPLGDLRFRPPHPHRIPYDSPAHFAVTPAKLCSFVCLEGIEPPANTDLASEDCLYLNVWAPKVLPSTLIPVRAYIHGGHDECSSVDPHSDGCAAVAKTNSVQVIFEFRRGPMGFLAHPATWDESNVTGNWALMDQQMALKWIQENIESFGGDPTKVLLFGNSAGAQGVEMNLVSPTSSGLFHSAISESPPCVDLPTLDQAYDFTQSFLPLVQCDGYGNPETELKCLRSIPWETMYDLTTNLYKEYTSNLLACSFRDRFQTFDYVVDGVTIPFQPHEALRQGKFNKVPYLVGTTVDEEMSTVNDHFGVENVTHVTLLEGLQELYPGVDPNYVLDVYPESLFASDPEPSLTRLAQIMTDISFGCPIYSRQLARTNGSNSATWQYRWGATPSCPPEWIHLRAHHACELYFVFGIMPVGEYPSGLCTFTEEEVKLSSVVLTAWTSMSVEGKPKWGNGTEWPTWDAVNQRTIFLDKNVKDIVDTKNMAIRCERLLESAIMAKAFRMENELKFDL